jgi:hypothetical protein
MSAFARVSTRYGREPGIQSQGAGFLVALDSGPAAYAASRKDRAANKSTQSGQRIFGEKPNDTHAGL